MKHPKDISGLHIGFLTILRTTGNRKWGHIEWLFRCDCGKEKTATKPALLGGLVKSCGCKKIERGKAIMAKVNASGIRAAFKHGMIRTPTWYSWMAMKNRCLDPNNVKYPTYGGRGITICPRWMDFLNFYADMGERPFGMTLDRKNTEGNYEPGNCRWATPKQQAENRVPMYTRTPRRSLGIHANTLEPARTT